MFAKRRIQIIVLMGLISSILILQVHAQDDLPHLRLQGTASQLMVGGEPFLILGGELGNSSASDLDYMEPIWAKLVQMNLNTVLAPVYWDRIEPQEGIFDFTLVDGLLDRARMHNLRLVLLWFGSWKNSMSCYVPEWVKTDSKRFDRARLKTGQAVEILSAFSEENLHADTRAFSVLMRHLRKVDSQQQTVIMVQVENEVGMLTDARDYSSAANDAFARPVPKKLIEYLKDQKDLLAPAIHKQWKRKGFKTSGTWQEVFGKGLATDEIFMAWHYGRYVDHVTAAGKAEYALPMYVNAALNRPGHKPGRYPSAGPLPHLMDIWRAAAPSIDFFSPDIYFPNLVEWCRRYHQSGNLLFIPEVKRGPDNGAQAFYAIGRHYGIGFSPFSIESFAGPENCSLSQSYAVLDQLSPLIGRHQGKATMTGVLLDKENSVQEITLGGYVLTVSHDYTWGWSGGDAQADTWPQAGGILISLSPDEYLIAGTGLIVTFASDQPGQNTGIVSIQEGAFKEGRWDARSLVKR